MSINPFYKDDYVVEYEGHTPAVLKQMPAESVHMILTSPPYFGLRSYGTEPQIWPCGCDVDHSEGCKHKWGNKLPSAKESHTNEGFAEYNKKHFRGGGHKAPEQTQDRPNDSGRFCLHCNAWKGDLGNEPTIDLYIDHLVLIFREAKRVLRKDGTLWIVIGDSHAGGGGASGHTDDTKNLGRRTSSYGAVATGGRVPSGLKPKDLCGIPWRLAFALQADGWWLRKDIIWEKPSCMPESISGWRWEKCKVKIGSKRKETQSHAAALGTRDHSGDFRLAHNQDTEYQDCPGCPKCEPNGGYMLRRGSWRPTSSHEYVFMFAKSEKYFADGEAVKENCVKYKIERAIREEKQGLKSTFKRKFDSEKHAPSKTSGLRSNEKNIEYAKGGRNLRSVLTADDNLNEFLKYCHETFGWDVEKAVGMFIGGQDERKDVFTINPEPTSEKHFAAFPSKLCEIIIKCSTSEKGCCPECGVPWVRIIERRILKELKDNPYCEDGQLSAGKKAHHGTHHSTLGGQQDKISFKTIGWKPSCECNQDYLYGPEIKGVRQGRTYFDSRDIVALKDIEKVERCKISPVPCIILDIFSGSGRALTTARKLGRKAIGIDLKREYLEMPLEELKRLDRWEKKSFKM